MSSSIEVNNYVLMLSTSEYSPGPTSTTHDQWLGRPAISYLSFEQRTSALAAKTAIEAARVGGLTVVALFKED